MQVNGLTITAASEQQFKKSLDVYPCSYNPTDNLKVGTNPDGKQCVLLPLESKRLWFFTYCKEAGKVGKIVPECNEIKFNLGPIGGATVGFVTAKTSVYIDDALISVGEAGHVFDMAKMDDLKNLVQTVTGLAQSRALTNAGFGSVDRLDIEQSGPNDGTPGDPNGPLPFTCPDGLNGAGSSSTPPSDPEVNPPSAPSDAIQQTFEMLGGNVDRVTLAKQTPYPLRGQYAGKTLGELPSRALEFLVSKLGGQPSPEVTAAQAAAKLILEDRQKASGKAIP